MTVDRVAGVIMAAGAAERFGAFKQVADFGGKPLLARAIDVALNSQLAAVFIVLDFRQAEICRFWEDLPQNPRLIAIDVASQTKAMSVSLKAGLAAAQAANFDAAMFLLGDQPFMETAFINRMLMAFTDSDRRIVAASSNGRFRNPVIFHRDYWPELMRVEGDVGGRSVIFAHPEQVVRVESEIPNLFVDIDTPDDLRKAKQLWRRHNPIAPV